MATHTLGSAADITAASAGAATRAARGLRKAGLRPHFGERRFGDARLARRRIPMRQTRTLHTPPPQSSASTGTGLPRSYQEMSPNNLQLSPRGGDWGGLPSALD